MGHPLGKPSLNMFGTTVTNLTLTERNPKVGAIWGQALRYLANVSLGARSLSKIQASTQPKQRNVEKPLLHRVLRQAGFKARHETTGKAKCLSYTPEENRPPLPRRSLQAMIANGQVGVASRTQYQIDSQGKENLERPVDVGSVDDTESHRDDSNSILDIREVPQPTI